MMNLTDSNELIAAGVSFTICDSDREFDDLGELCDTRHDMTGYQCMTAELEKWIAEQSADAPQEAEDWYDATDRREQDFASHEEWMHSLRSTYRLAARDKYSNRDFREMHHMSEWRYNRFVRLSKWVESCNSKRKLVEMDAKLSHRYKQSVSTCARSKNWWALYLTGDQVRSLHQYIDFRLTGR